ncbi:hypothetical protein WA026_020357 [Henosepilachna vigintioctopunctata]|uniref:Uncharacterized protein n=1 Tax=Henosepilachna vigintioctopunctata TaxID=420089 RepID=A0AAW1TNB3_9CUCU
MAIPPNPSSRTYEAFDPTECTSSYAIQMPSGLYLSTERKTARAKKLMEEKRREQEKLMEEKHREQKKLEEEKQQIENEKQREQEKLDRERQRQEDKQDPINMMTNLEQRRLKTTRQTGITR